MISPRYFRRMMMGSVLALVALSGCGKRGETPAPAADAADPTDLDAVRVRLGETLPPGFNVILMHEDEDEDVVRYEVSYSRPGFKGNGVAFFVEKDGPTVTITSGRLARFVYVDGKLENELAQEANEQQWAFLQQRAGEIAAATYAAIR